MKSISRWAYSHKRGAILLVISIKILLIGLAVLLGNLLTQNAVIIPGYVQGLILCCLLFIHLLYNASKWNYVKRKTLEACFILCTFAGMTSFVNSLDVNTGSINKSFATASFKKEKKPTAAEILESLKHRDKSSLSRTEKRILKKEFKLQLKKFAAYTLTGQYEKAEDSWKIVLTIIAAVGLLFLLAALVCNLSCNGSDAAAVIVGILGLVGLIWGTIAVIKAIQRRSEKPN